MGDPVAFCRRVTVSAPLTAENLSDSTATSALLFHVVAGDALKDCAVQQGGGGHGGCGFYER